MGKETPFDEEEKLEREAVESVDLDDTNKEVETRYKDEDKVENEEDEDDPNKEVYPMVRHLEFNDPEFEPVDNCYAEPAPSNPNS